MTASLPPDVQAVLDRFVTTELTTIDRGGQPITWPVTPYYFPGDPCIDVSTGLGYPKKAHDAEGNPLVALLFSDPTGSGLSDPPMVLVHGSADVDDQYLQANRERYAKESVEKPPGARVRLAPRRYRFRAAAVRLPYRGGAPGPFRGAREAPRPSRRARPGVWHPRINQLGTRYQTAVLSIVSPDGFPFSIRIPVSADESRRLVRILSWSAALRCPAHGWRCSAQTHRRHVASAEPPSAS